MPKVRFEPLIIVLEFLRSKSWKNILPCFQLSLSRVSLVMN